MIKKILSVAIAIVMITTLFIGCTKNSEVLSNKGDQEKLDSGENEVAPSELPEKVNEITLCESWGFENGFSTVITPENNPNFGINYYLTNFYETLVNYEDGEIVPGLAKSWSVSEDGLIYTFNLREGVKFSDGEDFNADVVKKNIEMIPILSGKYNGAFALVTSLFKEVQVVDEYVVEVHLISPYYGTLQDFTKLNPLGMMSPNAFNENNTLSDKLLTATLGTGPYMFDSQTDGSLYTFVRNPNYHIEESDVDKFHIKVIPENESKSLALRNGEIDMIFGASKISYDGFNELSVDNKYGTGISNTSINTRYLCFNLAKEPFDDKNVRLAVSHAIEKQNICNNLFYGIETKADTFFNRSLPYCDVEVEPYEYDIEKAIQLLEESGWKDLDDDGIREKDGKKLEGEIIYVVSGRAASCDELTLTFASFLKKIGMDIKVSGFDMMAWYEKMQKGDFTLVNKESYEIPNDPYTGVSNMNSDLMVDNALAQGLAHIEDGNSIIVKLSALVDKNEIQNQYNFILKEIHENAAFVPISYMKELIVFNSEKIANYEFNGQPCNFNASGIKLK